MPIVALNFLLAADVAVVLVQSKEGDDVRRDEGSQEETSDSGGAGVSRGGKEMPWPGGATFTSSMTPPPAEFDDRR